MPNLKDGNALPWPDSQWSVWPLESSTEFIVRSMLPNRCAKIAQCEPNGTENLSLMSLSIPQLSRKTDAKPDFGAWRVLESNPPGMSKISGETCTRTGPDSNKPV